MDRSLERAEAHLYAVLREVLRHSRVASRTSCGSSQQFEHCVGDGKGNDSCLGLLSYGVRTTEESWDFGKVN